MSKKPKPVPDQLTACGVLVVRGDPVRSFLLMEHANRLDLPKGLMEPGESHRECALRELEEETGITADDIELDDGFQFSTTYPVRYKKYGYVECDKTIIIYLGRLVSDVSIRVTEHQGFRWSDWTPPHRIQPRTIDPLLEALASYLGHSA